MAVAARDYEVRPGEHFAEIRVYRPSGQRGDSGFLWWTEAASAKPGVDYVQQGKVAHSFPKGKDSTSFFVKLIPKPLELDLKFSMLQSAMRPAVHLSGKLSTPQSGCRQMKHLLARRTPLVRRLEPLLPPPKPPGWHRRYRKLNKLDLARYN